MLLLLLAENERNPGGTLYWKRNFVYSSMSSTKVVA